MAYTPEHLLGLAPEFEAHWRKVGEAVGLGGRTLVEFQAAITDLREKDGVPAALRRNAPLAAAQRDTDRDALAHDGELRSQRSGPPGTQRGRDQYPGAAHFRVVAVDATGKGLRVRRWRWRSC